MYDLVFSMEHIFHPAHSGLFPPQMHLGKSGNLRSQGSSAKRGGMFQHKRSLVLFCSFRKQFHHRPGKI